MTVARRTPGRRPQTFNGGNRGRCGEMARQTLRGFAGCESEYNFCDMARTLRMGEKAFRRSCNFRELVRRCKNGTYYNFCVMRLMAAFVPHRSNKYFHVIASNGIVSSSPYISSLHLVASVRVFETFHDADVVALGSVRAHRCWCEIARSSCRTIIGSGDLLLVLHRQAPSSIHGYDTHRSALPRERFRPMGQNGPRG
jgi:hypothetical protein